MRSFIHISLFTVLFLLIIPASALERYKLGITVPFSGTSAEYGNYIREGFVLAHEHSVQKEKIALFFEDDECTGAKGAAATRNLIDGEGIDFLFGSFCSSVVMAQAPIVQAAGIVQMANAVAPQIRDAGDWTYRINPDGSAYLKALVPYLIREKKLKSVAVLHVVNDFGNTQSELFQKLAIEAGAAIAGVEEYLPGVTDFRGQILRLKTFRPQTIFVVGYAESTDAIRQIGEAKLDAVISASTPFDNPSFWRILEGMRAPVFFPSSYDPGADLESMKNFQKKYLERYRNAPTQYAMMGYEAFTIADKLLTVCGHNRRCMKEHMDRDTFQGVQGAIRFDEYGDAVRPVFIKRAYGGTARRESEAPAP